MDLISLASKEKNKEVVRACIEFSKKDIDPNSVSVKAIQGFLVEAARSGVIDSSSINEFKSIAGLNHRAAAKFAASIIHAKGLTSVVNELSSAIKSVPKQVAEGQEAKYLQTILTFGEVGALVDQSKVAGVVESINELFNNSNSQIRQAGAIALGDITIGNTGFFLELVLQRM